MARFHVAPFQIGHWEQGLSSARPRLQKLYTLLGNNDPCFINTGQECEGQRLLALGKAESPIWWPDAAACILCGTRMYVTLTEVVVEYSASEKPSKRFEGGMVVQWVSPYHSSTIPCLILSRVSIYVEFLMLTQYPHGFPPGFLVYSKMCECGLINENETDVRMCNRSIWHTMCPIQSLQEMHERMSCISRIHNNNTKC